MDVMQEDAASIENKEFIVELTAEVVSAYVSNNVIPASELPALIADVHKALGDVTVTAQEPVIIEKSKPAVPIKRSLQDDQIVCLECGLGFKSLKRHLTTHHHITPEQYREKWYLPKDYPMVAPAYAQARSRLAKEMGLGQKRTGTGRGKGRSK